MPYTRITIKKVRQKVESFCWFVVVAILVWQVIFSKISILSNLALLLLFASNLFLSGRPLKMGTVKVVLLIAPLVAYSMLLENAVGNIVRFTLILFFICCAYWIRMKNPEAAIRVLIAATSSFSICIIVLEVLFLFLGIDVSAARPILIAKGLGDIYMKYGLFYAVQLIGTSVIPFAYMFVSATDFYSGKRRFLLRAVFLVASLCAGNFMYIIGIAAYHFFDLLMSSRSRRYLRRHFLLWVFFFLLMPLFAVFIRNTLEEKKDFSSAVRVEQVQMLMSDMAETPGTFMFGQGLGNTIRSSGSVVSYGDEDVYFEVQAVYFLNQLGFFPFLLFILFNLQCTIKFIKTKKLRLVYLCYVLYGLSNPYILNTQHVVVIITLLCMEKIYNSQTCARMIRYAY